MENTGSASLSSLLDQSSSAVGNIGASGFAIVMAVSLVSCWFISALYLHFYGSRATGSQIHRAFPLLGLSVTAIFISIQFSLPLSLGLLGALSIVRFRTPIKEPEEIGFIMLVIGCSIAVATFSLYFLVILLGFATIACYVQKSGIGFINRTSDDGILLLTVNGDEYRSNAEAIRSLMKQKLIEPKVESISKSGPDSVISYSFKSLREEDPVNLQLAIENLLGDVETNIYFNKQATL